MQVSKTLLALGVASALLVGCKKQDEAAAAEAATARADASTEQAEAPAPETAAPETAAPETPDASAAPAVTAFDINKIPVSDAALPAWPYVALPAGYHYYYSEDLASRSKDLARVPVWTGGQLLWIEGKTFSDAIRSDEGKTYSKFEVRKNLQQAIEALGGVRLAERSFDETVWDANENDLQDFRQEFDRMQNAYWYDKDVDTYVIRRADKAIWVVAQTDNGGGALMVAEGPLPEAPAK